MTLESDSNPVTALERFVVDNEDLLALEERIGRFNVFDALRIDRAEIRHSNFLAWLLNPAESHGLGALFLRSILMDLLKKARENGFPVPVSPIDIDGADLPGVEVRREWRRIDLLITCDDPQFVIAIENKVDSGEHTDQLARYRRVVAEHFGDTPRLFVFLTREGDEPSDDDWVPYSYRDIYEVLTRVERTNAASIGGDIAVFLEHYLRLIGSRFMDDPQIDELCRKIYTNHRQAIDLIVERMGASSGVFADLIRAVDSIDELIVLKKTGVQLHVIPAAWDSMLPAIGDQSGFDPRHWIRIVFTWLRAKNTVILNVLACPTANPELRRRFIERLTGNPTEFGLNPGTKKITDQWTRLHKKDTLIRWEDGEEPEAEKVEVTVRSRITSLLEQLRGVPEALTQFVNGE